MYVILAEPKLPCLLHLPPADMFLLGFIVPVTVLVIALVIIRFVCVFVCVCACVCARVCMCLYVCVLFANTRHKLKCLFRLFLFMLLLLVFAGLLTRKRDTTTSKPPFVWCCRCWCLLFCLARKRGTGSSARGVPRASGSSGGAGVPGGEERAGGRRRPDL